MHGIPPRHGPFTCRSCHSWCLCSKVNPRRWCEADTEIPSPQHDTGTSWNIKHDGRLDVRLSCLKQGSPCWLVPNGGFWNHLQEQDIQIHVIWSHAWNSTDLFFLSFYFKYIFAFLHSSYSWWLKTSVNRCVSNTIGFHGTNNSTDDLICWRQKHSNNNLKMYKNE